jgi:hypothetical protein
MRRDAMSRCPATLLRCETPTRCSEPAGCMRTRSEAADVSIVAWANLKPLDATYKAHLESQDPAKLRAWLTGEWDVTETVVTRDDTRRCTMGVGCDEVGQCYADAHGEPDRCCAPARKPATPARCPWDQWKSARDV